MTFSQEFKLIIDILDYIYNNPGNLISDLKRSRNLIGKTYSIVNKYVRILANGDLIVLYKFNKDNKSYRAWITNKGKFFLTVLVDLFNKKEIPLLDDLAIKTNRKVSKSELNEIRRRIEDED